MSDVCVSYSKAYKAAIFVYSKSGGLSFYSLLVSMCFCIIRIAMFIRTNMLPCFICTCECALPLCVLFINMY